MVEEIRTIGNAEGLRFEFRFDRSNPASRRQAWGRAMLFLGDEVIWADDDGCGVDVPFAWSWFDLLEFLAESWPWLVLEQRYPIPVNPLYPGMFVQDAERRWQDLPEALVDEEAVKVYAFSLHHDLAMAIKGAFFPSVVLMRRGNEYLVSVPFLKKTRVVASDDILETLSQVGDLLAGMVDEEGTGHIAQVVRQWRDRESVLHEKKIEILSGLDVDARTALECGQNPLDYWEVADRHDSELLAVARMTSVVYSGDVQATLIRTVRDEPLHETEVLDALSVKAALVAEPDLAPYEQGYRLAAWLRDELGIAKQETVEPEALLNTWHVEVREIDLPSMADALDAVAAWGETHGPVIVLNVSTTSRNAHEFGRRSTLAHEICHLLVDRQGGLPMAEVLGGMTPNILEKRARAFAAEFLFPQAAAIDALEIGNSVTETIRAVSEHFRVSREVAAWQIRNAPGLLSMPKADQDEIARIVRDFEIRKES